MNYSNKIRAVIFDLDGVIVKTDRLHYLAWKRLGDEIGISDFDESDGARQRGVSRMASLEILLEKGSRVYSEAEKVCLADRKNSYYSELLGTLDGSAILPGINELISYLKVREIKIAVGSVSRNTKYILERAGLSDCFDAVVDGYASVRSKPEPDIFLLAAEKLGVMPRYCAVIEDACAGIEAAKKAGMKSVAVGKAAYAAGADYYSDSTAFLPDIIRMMLECEQ